MQLLQRRANRNPFGTLLTRYWQKSTCGDSNEPRQFVPAFVQILAHLLRSESNTFEADAIARTCTEIPPEGGRRWVRSTQLGSCCHRKHQWGSTRPLLEPQACSLNQRASQAPKDVPVQKIVHFDTKYHICSQYEMMISVCRLFRLSKESRLKFCLDNLVQAIVL